MGSSIISGQCYGYPIVLYRDANIPCYLGCCFEVLSFAAYPGYPLVPYRDANIPCYLGCCFEVLSFAAYPGYPLVPYRDTNIPCYLSRCFEGTIFRSVTWVARVIRANTVPARIMTATQATRSILYLGQEFRQIKWPRVTA